MEIENVEVMMTDQGLLFYKLYSNGHPYDTSLVWIAFMRSLIAAQRVPGRHPTKTFEKFENL